MSVFKTIGHFVASLGVAIVNIFAGTSPADSAAMSVATGVANLLQLLNVIPNAVNVLHAAMAVLGDVVAAVRVGAAAAKAGEPFTVEISAFAIAAVQKILPDVEKAIQAFEATAVASTQVPPSPAPAVIATATATS